VPSAFFYIRNFVFISCFAKSTCLDLIDLIALIKVNYKKRTNYEAVLGGVVVIVLGITPKVRGFKPSRERYILRAIKYVARLPSEGK
jgi:hypothetical protein